MCVSGVEGGKFKGYKNVSLSNLGTGTRTRTPIGR
jgi:hypothetical protein